MLKLSELKAARAKMEPGPYTHDPCEPPAGSVHIRGSRCTCDDPKAMCPMHEHVAEWVPLDTAIGIEATHAATDVLVEIVEAALEWRSTLGRPRGDRAADVAEQRLLRLLGKVEQ